MCRCEASQPPKSKFLKIQQVDKKKFWDHIWTPGIILRRLVPSKLESKVEMDYFWEKNIFVSFSYINIRVNFDLDFSLFNLLFKFSIYFWRCHHKFWASVLERFQTPIHQNFGMGMFLGLLRCVLIPKVSGLAHWVGYYGVCWNSLWGIIQPYCA